MQVCDEVECVEKTLLKRRAELREADRLLLEAQSCINTSREQVHTHTQTLTLAYSGVPRETDYTLLVGTNTETFTLRHTQIRN